MSDRGRSDGSSFQVGGVISETVAICDGARVEVSDVGPSNVALKVFAHDKLATSQIHLTPHEADELADRLRTQATEVRARTEADE